MRSEHIERGGHPSTRDITSGLPKVPSGPGPGSYPVAKLPEITSGLVVGPNDQLVILLAPDTPRSYMQAFADELQPRFEGRVTVIVADAQMAVVRDDSTNTEGE